MDKRLSVLVLLAGVQFCAGITLMPAPKGARGTIDFRYPDIIVDPLVPCPNEGVFPHPRNCTWYYRCYNRTIEETGHFSRAYFECETGTVFSDDLDQCVFPHRAKYPCGTYSGEEISPTPVIEVTLPAKNLYSTLYVAGPLNSLVGVTPPTYVTQTPPPLTMVSTQVQYDTTLYQTVVYTYIIASTTVVQPPITPTSTETYIKTEYIPLSDTGLVPPKPTTATITKVVNGFPKPILAITTTVYSPMLTSTVYETVAGLTVTPLPSSATITTVVNGNPIPYVVVTSTVSSPNTVIGSTVPPSAVTPPGPPGISPTPSIVCEDSYSNCEFFEVCINGKEKKRASVCSVASRTCTDGSVSDICGEGKLYYLKERQCLPGPESKEMKCEKVISIKRNDTTEIVCSDSDLRPQSNWILKDCTKFILCANNGGFSGTKDLCPYYYECIPDQSGNWEIKMQVCPNEMMFSFKEDKCERIPSKETRCPGT